MAATAANAMQNGVADRVQARAGSLPELLQEVDRRGLPFRILTANLVAATLESMLSSGLPSAVGSTGVLVLSGILQGQLDALLNLADTAGLRPVDVMVEGDWRTPILKRIPPPPA